MSMDVQSSQIVASRTQYGYGASSTPTSSPPVMPEPQPMSDDGGGDPMAALYAVLSKQRNNDMASGQANVEHNRELEKAQQAQEEKALQQQEQAQENAAKWGIFGKIASVIAIAVSAVAAACSCGAASALCVGACALSAMAFAEGETHVLMKLTNNPDVEKAFQFGCGIGAALCSGGAGIASLGANAFAGAMQITSSACKITQESVSTFATGTAAQYVAMAFGIGSAAASLGGGVAGVTGFGKAASTVAETTKEGAEAVTTVGAGVGGTVGESVGASAEGAAQAATSASTIKGTMGAVNDMVRAANDAMAGTSAMGSAFCEADATDRGADAKQAELAISRLQQLTEFVIDGVKESDDSHQRALQTLSGAMQTKAQTLVIASARV